LGPPVQSTPPESTSPADALLRAVDSRKHAPVHSERVGGLSFLEWSQQIPEPKGPLDFERFPFQSGMYEALGDSCLKDVVVMKGVQLGVSALLIRLGIFFPDTGRLTSLYVFPARQQLRDFVDTRLTPLLQAEFLAGRVSVHEIRNKGLLQLSQGFTFFRGSETKRDLISVDADVLLLDEYDELVASNVPEAEGRLVGSRLGLIRRVGAPSDPSFGIAELFEQSDQRRWLVTCACGEVQEVDFFKNVRWDEDEAGNIIEPRRVCSSCEASLDVARGEWVATFPGRPSVGFHVTRLMVPDTDLRPMIRASKRREPGHVRKFWNNDLGLPYSDTEAGLDREVIAAAVSAGESFNNGIPLVRELAYSGTNFVTMGVDVASTRALNVRISEHLDPFESPGYRKRALMIGTVEDFDALPGLMSTPATMPKWPSRSASIRRIERSPCSVCRRWMRPSL